jgi:zinc transport system substrate-binding protein
MKNRRIALLAFGFLAVLAFASFSGTPASAQANTQVVCTNSILADFTGELLGTEADVSYIMPAGACPSHFDTRPSDVDLIASADIVVSLGWEPWLLDLLTSSGNSGVQQVKCPGLGEWNVPSGAKAHVDKITEGLGQALPSLNATIQSNAQA